MTYKSLVISLLAVFTLIVACAGDKPKNNSNSNKVEVSADSKDKNINKSEASVKKTSDNASSMTPEQLATADKLISDNKNNIADIDSKKLFKMHCALCHGVKGNMTMLGAKNLTKSNIPLNEAVAQVYFGKGRMKAYKGLIKDADILAVAKYAESLRK